MSEFIDNSKYRKEKLKELILKLHSGEDEEKVKEELQESLRSIPYGEVVEVEQELIEQGLPETEVLKLCDVHSSVLQGSVDLSTYKEIPENHPLDIMIKENKELKKVTSRASELLKEIKKAEKKEEMKDQILELRGLFNNLMDVDKHYQRKEYLIFPYLEKEGITGPPKVMWGKHDEIRDQVKGAIEVLETEDVTAEELAASSELVLEPAIKGVEEMTIKEEEILFPMVMDTLTEQDWYQVQSQSLEIGFCLYDPPEEWKPEGIEEEEIIQQTGDRIQLPSGSFSTEELVTVLNTLPIDITFVDKDDKVKYFSQSAERVFPRTRAIINRDVRHCHPPASSHIVDQILEDFKSGKENRAPFWINLGGKLIHIEYFALRNEQGDYLGTLEVSHDVKRYKELEGEQRILSYTKD